MYLHPGLSVGDLVAPAWRFQRLRLHQLSDDLPILHGGLWKGISARGSGVRRPQLPARKVASISHTTCVLELETEALYAVCEPLEQTRVNRAGLGEIEQLYTLDAYGNTSMRCWR